MSAVSWAKRTRPGADEQPQPRSLVQSLLRLWHGPADLPRGLRIERQLVGNRYLACAFLLPTLPLMQLAPWQLWIGYTLVCIAVAYNFGVQVLIRQRSPWLNHGYVTSVGDSLLALSMVLIGGGFDTSFIFLLFTIALSTGMRFGYGPSLMIVGFFISIDAVITATHGAMQFRGDFLLRTSLLILTALLSSYLWDQAHAAELALARQLERAHALNASTRALGTSLQLDVVARLVAVEARRLGRAEAAFIQLNAGFGDLTMYDVRSRNEPVSPLDIERLFSANAAQAAASGSTIARSIQLEDGRAGISVPLSARGETHGVAIVLRAGHQPAFSSDDEQLLTSFLDRAALAIENASLYKTLDDRSHDLQRAYADLAAAHQDLLSVDEMKTSFIANVSHELRTPLTSIRSFSELLLSYEVDLNTEREFLGIINTESERLTRLINDVLDVTKIEAGYVDWRIQQLDLNELLKTSHRTFVSLTEEKQLAFDLVLPTAPTFVHADHDRMLQVLANLLGNAIKFTSQGTITLAAQIVNNTVQVTIRDTGVGIDPADHERIFDKFHQVGDTLTDKPKGTGLGLCICRDIVLHHGGRIWVESQLGQGSVFSFTLPLAGEPAPAPSKPASPSVS
jgi:signal transduction histidine kinase